MPGDVDAGLDHSQSEAHEDEAEEHADEEASSGASAAVAERNEWQAGAIVGRGRSNASAVAPPMTPTRHRRGAAVLDGAPLALPGHHRVQARMPETLLASQMKTHRRGTPLMAPAETPLAEKTGVSDSSASSMMALKRAQQADRISAPAPAIGFAGHTGGTRNKPTVAAPLTGAMAENDLMRNVAHKQREGTAAELSALGPGRAPGYRGKDEASADMREIIEDPRFEKQYAVDRAADHGGAVGRAISEKRTALSEFMESPDRGKQLGKAAARTAVRALPLVGTGAAFAGAYKDHGRAGVDDEVAHDEAADPLTRATATGLAESHRDNRNKEAVSGVVGLAKDVTTVATGGLGALVPGLPGGEHAAHAAGSLLDRGKDKLAQQMTPGKLAEKAAWKAGKKAGAGINAGGDFLSSKRDKFEMRKDAVAPSGVGRKDLIEQGTDRANEGALDLAAGDGRFGARLLNHLNAPAPAFAEPGLDHDAALPRVLSAARQVDRRDNKKAEHNLQPSKVSRMIRGEDARQRQKERMGGALGKLTKNEAGRGFWEKSAGVDVREGGLDVTPYKEAPGAGDARAKAKDAALAHSVAPEHDEDEDEDEE